LQVDYINTIERLAKSIYIRSGDIDNYTKEILKESALVLKCERTNAWLFEGGGDSLISLNSYESSKNKFNVEDSLRDSHLPNYFNYLKKGEIIVSNNASKENINKELLDIYINPNHITAMIDVPLRSEGEMIGVICFEHVKIKHDWSMEEQKFAQSLAQLLSLALETNKKKLYREKLEKIIAEKEVLIAEVNHRVKNNMSVIISLLELQKLKSEDDHGHNLLDEVIKKVYSMSAIQDRLHISDDFSEINLKVYLSDLVNNLNESYGANKNIHIILDLEPVLLDITKAVPLGLIANEVLTNAFKYAFNSTNSDPTLEISCSYQNDKILVRIKDNGPGMKKSDLKHGGMGHELIDNLCKQISGEMNFNFTNGVEMNLLF
jgi:two-component sensor histidine kinase